MKTVEEIAETTKEQIDVLTRKEVIKYIISCVLLGSLTFFSRKANLGALQFTFIRVFLATFLLLAIFVISKRRATIYHYSKRQLIYLFISGICIGLNWLIIADSSATVGVTTTTLTYSLGPGLLLITSPILFKDVQITPTKVAGFLICSIGVFLMDDVWFDTSHTLAKIFSVFVAAVFTVVIVYCNRQLENIDGLENATFQTFIGFIIITFVYITNHGLYFEIPSPGSWWVLAAGFFCTGIPIYLYLSSIDDLRPDIIAFAGYIRPLTTMAISSFVFGEKLTSDEIIGAILILGGVAVANFFRRKNLRKNRTF